MRYLLRHGFGFDHSYWDNLVPFLDHDYSFFDDDFKYDPNEKYIGIGHSIGFQKLNNSGINFECLIGLQGFLNFCGIKDAKMRTDNIDQIIGMLKIDANKLLSNFFAMCGYSGKLPKQVPEEDLLADLMDMKVAYKHCGCPTLIIGSKDDQIVPTSLIEENFAGIDNVTIDYISPAAHALGFVKPKETFEVIKRYIACSIKTQNR